jgi:hypothetical protein
VNDLRLSIAERNCRAVQNFVYGPNMLWIDVYGCFVTRTVEGIHLKEEHARFLLSGRELYAR